MFVFSPRLGAIFCGSRKRLLAAHVRALCVNVVRSACHASFYIATPCEHIRANSCDDSNTWLVFFVVLEIRSCRRLFAMSSILTKEFKKKFEAILALENKVPVNEIFMQGMSCLAEHSLMYEQVITCDKLLPHKENRGGLMLSPQNAHKNAMHIIGVGADRTFLSNAVCIELAPDGPQRTANLEKNRLLIQKSQGLLAPMNDGERFLTLGCGHTAAFCKAAKSGCRTTQTGLADAKGKIDLHKLVANTEFRAMIYEGWSWKVISHTVDVEFPAWAKLAQKALNTGNHASTQVGELETSCSQTS